MASEPKQPSSCEFSPHLRLSGARRAGLLIVVDHARPALPAAYGDLGLEAEQFERHIAYDIGIEGVARQLNERLDVPVVMATFSRLLIDPNRGEDDPTLVMRLSDGAVIPENARISRSGIERRADEFYRPYHTAIDDEIDAFLAEGLPPVLLSLHSFTNIWRGKDRALHAGILWDRDDRFALPLLQALRGPGDLHVGDNEPYTGQLKGDCMYRHGTLRGIAHALLEIRQDLIRDDAGQAAFAARLADMLAQLLANEDLMANCREIRHFGSVTDGL